MSTPKTNGADSGLRQPVFRERKDSRMWKFVRNWMPKAGMVIVSLFLALLVWMEISGQGDPLTVNFKETHELRPGSPVRLGINGPIIGRVDDFTLSSDFDGAEVTLEINREGDWDDRLLGRLDRSVWERVCQEGTTFQIVQFHVSKQFGVEGEEAPLRGAAVVVTLHPNEGAEFKDHFVGLERRPLEGIDASSERVRVFWPELHGIEYGFPVRHRGTDVGKVEAIEPGKHDDHNGWFVQIAFDRTINAADFLPSGTEYYIDFTSNEGLRVFSPEGLIRGSVLEIRKAAQPNESPEYFVGKLTPPPDSRIGPDSPRIAVKWESVFGLRPRAVVLDNKSGREIGQVLDVSSNSGEPVVIGFFDKDNPYVRESASYHVDRVRTNRSAMTIEGSETLFTGVKVKVLAGNPEGKLLTEIDGSVQPPPDPRVDWDDLRLFVDFTDTKGIRVGAPVTAGGRTYGEVLGERDAPRSGLTRLELVFYDYNSSNADECALVLSKTRYYANSLDVSFRGIAGDARTMLEGSSIVAVPDPYYEGQSTRYSLKAQTGAPPKHLPQRGERELAVNCEQVVPADTPVIVNGRVVGYVHRVYGFKAYVRLIPDAQQRIYTHTKFYVPKVVKSQVLRKKAWNDWEGPRFDVDHNALLERSITFRTPPEERGKKCDMHKSYWTFTLHREPKAEWEEWDW